jgi:hypothetical protein
MGRGKNYAALQHSRKLEENRKKLEAGLVSERFPRVTKITFEMLYFQTPPGHVLMERTVRFFPTSAAYFFMKCFIKDCTEGGGFDLAPVVASLIRRRKKSGKGTMVCTGKGDGLPEDHSHISYEITIGYRSR